MHSNNHASNAKQTNQPNTQNNTKRKQKKRTYHKQTKRSECLKELQTWQKCLNMKLSCSDDDLLSSSESQLSASCSPAICPGILNSPLKESLMTPRRLHRSQGCQGGRPRPPLGPLRTSYRTFRDVLNVPPCVPLKRS